MKLATAFGVAALALSACSFVGDVLSPRQEETSGGEGDGASTQSATEGGTGSGESGSGADTGSVSTSSDAESGPWDMATTGVMEVTDVGGDEPTTWGETGFGDVGVTSFDTGFDTGLDTSTSTDTSGTGLEEEAISACQAACNNLGACGFLIGPELQMCKDDCFDAVVTYTTWGDACVGAFADYQTCVAILSCPELMIELSSDVMTPCADEEVIFQNTCQI